MPRKASSSTPTALERVWSEADTRGLIDRVFRPEAEKLEALVKRLRLEGHSEFDDATIAGLVRRLMDVSRDPIRWLPLSVKPSELLASLAQAPKPGRQRTHPGVLWLRGEFKKRDDEFIESWTLLAAVAHRAIRKALREGIRRALANDFLTPSDAEAAAMRLLRPKQAEIAGDALAAWAVADADRRGERRPTDEELAAIREIATGLSGRLDLFAKKRPSPQDVRRGYNLQAPRTRRRR